jgi:hypothetical protein
MKTLLLPSQIGAATHAQVTVQDGTEPQRTAGFVYTLGTLQEQPTPDAILTEEGITVQPADPAPIFTPTEGERWTYCATAGSMTDEEIASYIVEYPVVSAPTIVIPPTVAQYTIGVQNWLDNEAQKLGYDNSLSLCTYVTSNVTKFKEEAQIGVNRRDYAWSYCYNLLGSAPAVMPSVEELTTQIASSFSNTTK